MKGGDERPILVQYTIVRDKTQTNECTGGRTQVRPRGFFLPARIRERDDEALIVGV